MSQDLWVKSLTEIAVVIPDMRNWIGLLKGGGYNSRTYYHFDTNSFSLLPTATVVPANVTVVNKPNNTPAITAAGDTIRLTIVISFFIGFQIHFFNLRQSLALWFATISWIYRPPPLLGSPEDSPADHQWLRYQMLYCWRWWRDDQAAFSKWVASKDERWRGFMASCKIAQRYI